MNTFYRLNKGVKHSILVLKDSDQNVFTPILNMIYRYVERIYRLSL